MPELDRLLGGGWERGTSALFAGPSGAGRSVLASHYVAAAARRNECSAICLFDETIGTFMRRSDSLGNPLGEHSEAGCVKPRQLNPAELSLGEFNRLVRDAVVLLRYVEAAGELRRAISIVKKPTGAHEATLRELRLLPPVQVGGPLSDFSGVLTSALVYIGGNTALLGHGSS